MINKKAYTDHYVIESVDHLFRYGKELIANREYDKAKTCFYKCVEVSPNHAGACFQLFLLNIQSQNYEQVLEYFTRFYNCKPKFYNVDSNLYLYLLSMIIDLPEDYKAHVKNLKHTDLVNFNNEKITLQNKIRLSIFNQRFLLAYSQSYELFKESGKISSQDIIVKMLLSQIIQIEEKNKRDLLELIQNKQYQDAFLYLSKAQDQHCLSILDSSILLLLKDLIKMKKTNCIPKMNPISTDNLFEAIDVKNYELAFSLLKSHSNVYMIEILLKEIINTIEELKKISNETKSSISNLEDFTQYFVGFDLNNIYKNVRDYLEGINQKQYIPLVMELVNISLTEGDGTFSKPIIVLNQITNGTFVFSIAEYIQKFYVCLSQYQFDQANIYLHIISKSKHFGQTCILTSKLKQIFEYTKQSYSNSDDLGEEEKSLIFREKTFKI